jgi:ribosomal protein S18 acetylase RimI-like enzyme
VLAYYPEVSVLGFNHAADINVDQARAVELLEEVTDFFSSRKFPYTCFRLTPLTRPKSLATLLTGHGFIAQLEMSAMVYRRKQANWEHDPELTVKEVTARDLEPFVELLFAIFDMPAEWKAGFGKLFQARIQGGGKLFMATIGRNPVGISGLLSAMNAGLIYGVGTLKEYQGRGVGTSLTMHAVGESVKEGNDLHSLHAESGGYAEKFYGKLGFKADHTISYLTRHNR